MKAAVPLLRGRVLDLGCGVGQLAKFVAPDDYLGIDRDGDVIGQARARFPDHEFQVDLPQHGGFDTVAALAVIEHLQNPAEHVARWAQLLADGGQIIVTTPHPAFDRFHEIGAGLGLFSQHADEEHEDLLDQHKLEQVAQESGLEVKSYRRFLFGANQICVLANKG